MRYLLLVILTTFLPLAAAADSSRIALMSGQYSIRTSFLDGSAPDDVVRRLEPTSVAADPTSGRIYFGTNVGIYRANLDGTGTPVPVVNKIGGNPSITGLELDPGAQKIYWADGVRIYRANLDGTGEEQLFADGVATVPKDIVLDTANGVLYWCEQNGIFRAPLSNPVPELVAAIGCWDLAADFSGGRLFVADSTLIRMNLDGSQQTTIHDFPQNGSYTYDVEFDPASGNLFFVRELEKIVRSDADGQNIVEITGSGGGYVSRLAFDGGSLYAAITPFIYELPLAGGDPRTIVDGALNGADLASALGLGGVDEYWTDKAPHNDVRMFDAATREIRVLASGFSAVGAICADPARERLYFAAQSGGFTIFASDLRGGALRPLFSAVSLPGDCVADADGKTLYWSEPDRGLILKGEIGRGRVSTAAANIGFLGGFAVVKKKIYLAASTPGLLDQPVYEVTQKRRPATKVLFSLPHVVGYHPRFGAYPFSTPPYDIFASESSERLYTLASYRGLISTDLKGRGEQQHSTESASELSFPHTPGDPFPPAIARVKVSLKRGTLKVEWRTNETTTGEVEYGPTGNYGGRSSRTSKFSKSSSLKIARPAGTAAGTPGHLRVRVRDKAGNLALSGDVPFTW